MKTTIPIILGLTIGIAIALLFSVLIGCSTYKVVSKRPHDRRIAPEYFIDSKGKILIYVPGEGGFWDKKQFKDK